MISCRCRHTASQQLVSAAAGINQCSTAHDPPQTNADETVLFSPSSPQPQLSLKSPVPDSADLHQVDTFLSEHAPAILLHSSSLWLPLLVAGTCLPMSVLRLPASVLRLPAPSVGPMSWSVAVAAPPAHRPQPGLKALTERTLAARTAPPARHT